MRRAALDLLTLDVGLRRLGEDIRTRSATGPHAPLLTVFAGKLDAIANAIAELERYVRTGEGAAPAMQEAVRATFNDADWLAYQALTGVAHAQPAPARHSADPIGEVVAHLRHLERQHRHEIPTEAAADFVQGAADCLGLALDEKQATQAIQCLLDRTH